MSLPYIEQQNLRFVPILRQRLSFAILVRRAIRALGNWSRRDLIAVALPASVGEKVKETLLKYEKTCPLPVRLVVTAAGKEHEREVFPITPCDAYIEAIRMALEHGWSLAFIDREVVPGNLTSRICLKDPDWPDDDLALRFDAREYLGLLSPHLEQPPVRFEPIDSWREDHMSESLRRLQPYYRRILVVLEATHQGHVSELLRSASLGLEQPPRTAPELQAPRTAPGLDLTVVRPKVEVMIQNLDDFPKLTELYERRRKDGTATDFDKLTELLRIIQSIERQAGEAQWGSARRFGIFQRYLRGLLEANRHTSPRPYEVYEACWGCYGRSQADNALHQLAAYGKEIDVERIGRVVGTGAPVWAISDPDADSVKLSVIEEMPNPKWTYVSRSCNQTSPNYVIKPRPARLPGDLHDKVGLIKGIDFAERMSRKAVELCLRQTQRRRSQPFRGSLEAGVDARRTMRSLLTPSPRIYVKSSVRRQADEDIFGEPIVWLAQPREVPEDRRYEYELKCLCGEFDGRDLIESTRYWGPDQTVHEAPDGSVRITRKEVLGRLIFTDSTDAAHLKKTFGTEILKRVPDHSGNQIFGLIGCIPANFEPYVDDNYSWWEILLLWALRYARHVVPCVVPDGFRVPGSVTSRAAADGKRVVCVSLSRFTRAERSRFFTEYIAWVPRQGSKDEATKERARELLATLGID